MMTPLRKTSGFRASRFFLALTLALVAAGCSALAPGKERDRAELEHYWSSWQLHGSTSYQYVQRRLCYCLLEATLAVRVTVRDGVVIQRRYVDEDAPVPLQLATAWGTIDDLFRLIENALENDAASLLVTYDRRLGYPTHISIDYDAVTADDEIVITSSAVTFLDAAGVQVKYPF